MSLYQLVIQSYRKLLKSQKQLFINDRNNLGKAKNYTRSMFEENRNVNDPQQIKELIQVAVDSSKIIDEKIVQAEIKNENTIRVQVRDTTFKQTF